MLDKVAIAKLIKAKASRRMADWIESDGIPQCQALMESLHYDTGRLAASIHQVDDTHIVIGGTSETPTGRDDGNGSEIVDYAISVEAKYAPVRGSIVPLLEQLTGGTRV